MKNLSGIFIIILFSWCTTKAQLIISEPVNDTVCITDSAIFTVMVIPEVSVEWQYAINPIAGPWTVPTVGVSGAQTTTLQVFQPGIYSGNYFRVVAMDINGVLQNDTSISVLLTVNQNPSVTIVSIPSGFAFCEGGSIVLQTLDMNPSYSYQWGPMGQTSPSITIDSGGTYTVTVTDDKGCMGSSAQQVIERPSPTPQILPLEQQAKFCPGKSVELMSDSMYAHYSWSSPPGGNNSFITVSTVGTYMLTVTDENNCTASTSRIVGMYHPASIPSISPVNKEFCQGNDLWLVGNSGYDKYEWNTGPENDSLLVNMEDTYTLTVTDVNGCTATNVAVVNENPIPIAAFSTNPPNLAGGSVQAGTEIKFTDASSYSEFPIDTWNWDFGEGASIMNASYGVKNNMTEVIYSEEGSVNVCLETIDQKLCVDTTCLSFEVTPSGGPNVTLNLLSNPMCIGDAFEIEAFAVLIGNPINDSLRQSIDWDFDPSFLNQTGSVLITGTNIAIQERATFVFTSQGMTAITATARQFDKDNESEFEEGFASKLVSSGSEVPTIAMSVIPPYLCDGLSGSITLEILPNGNGKIYYIQNGMNLILDIVNGDVTIPVNTSGSIGSVAITIDRIEVDGCPSEMDVLYEIPIRLLPPVEISGPKTVCLDDTTFLMASGAESYIWKVNNISPPSNMDDSIQVKSDILGLFDYEVLGTLNGCAKKDSILVNVTEIPTPEIFGDSLVCQGQVVEYSSFDTVPVHHWVVDGGTLLSQVDDKATVKWGDFGLWSLQLTQNVESCQGHTSKPVTVSEDHSPFYDSLVYLKGGRILLYSNPGYIPGLCYQWYKENVPMVGEVYQGFVVPDGVPENQLNTYSVKVWFCSEGEACAQEIGYRSDQSPKEEHTPMFSVVPNPNNGYFELNYSGLERGNYVQQILNTSGGILNHEEFLITSSTGKLPVSLQYLAAAVYFIRWVNTSTGSVFVTQVVLMP